jgi:hypothetical protein
MQRHLGVVEEQLVRVDEILKTMSVHTTSGDGIHAPSPTRLLLVRSFCATTYCPTRLARSSMSCRKMAGMSKSVTDRILPAASVRSTCTRVACGSRGRQRGRRIEREGTYEVETRQVPGLRTDSSICASDNIEASALAERYHLRTLGSPSVTQASCLPSFRLSLGYNMFSRPVEARRQYKTRGGRGIGLTRSRCCNKRQSYLPCSVVRLCVRREA